MSETGESVISEVGYSVGFGDLIDVGRRVGRKVGGMVGSKVGLGTFGGRVGLRVGFLVRSGEELCKLREVLVSSINNVTCGF
jgi:hypothetical protein